MSAMSSGNGYLILAYVISLTLLWGYTVLSWIESGRLRRRQRRQTSA